MVFFNSKYTGVTVKKLVVNTYNVRNPEWKSTPESVGIGLPSIAIFASKDTKNWFNFLEVEDLTDTNTIITNWKFSNFSVENPSVKSCLGGVYNTYLVACLNVNNMATYLKKGEIIRPPPFNDRCFQVDGVCGVPCARLTNINGEHIQEPPYCHNGKIDRSLLITNATDSEKFYGHRSW